jgi:nucleotide-binding universal stress UspA family protein
VTPMAIPTAIDDSDPAQKALEHVFSEHPNEEITVLHVISLPESTTVGEARMHINWDELRESKREHAETLFDETRELAAAQDVKITTETAVGRPDREILEYVERRSSDGRPFRSPSSADRDRPSPPKSMLVDEPF